MHAAMWVALALAMWACLSLVAAPLLASALRVGREPYGPTSRLQHEIERTRR